MASQLQAVIFLCLPDGRIASITWVFFLQFLMLARLIFLPTELSPQPVLLTLDLHWVGHILGEATAVLFSCWVLISGSFEALAKILVR